MANWEYADYVRPDLYPPGSESYRVRLAMHIEEVSQRIFGNTTSSSLSTDSSPYNQYLEYLRGKMDEANQVVDRAKPGGSMSHVRLPSRRLPPDRQFVAGDR